MTVDTAAMRLVARTILHQEHCTSLEDDAQALLDSAADEIERLRDTLIVERSLRVKSERELATEREAHGCAIRMNNDLGKELEEEKKRLESAEAALSFMQNSGCEGISEAGCVWCLTDGLVLTTEDMVNGKHHESCPIGQHFARYGGKDV